MPVGKRPAQIGPIDRRVRDHLVYHHRLKAAADGLDFGQFGHRAAASIWARAIVPDRQRPITSGSGENGKAP
jgi:hypothetical protein